MPPTDEVLYERRGRSLHITINRPDKHNPLSRGVLEKLRTLFLQAGEEDDLACVVLSGAGQRYFAAGGDLRDLAEVRSTEQTQAMSRQARAALDAVRECPVPVIALLQGDAIGGGAELALACDMRVMREGTRIGFIHGKLQITSAWGGGPDLVALIGSARALRMTTRCELIPAQLALQWGLADAVAPADDTSTVLAEFIAPMLRMSGKVLRGCKAQTLAWRQGRTYAERRQIEQEALVETWTHDDHWTAVAPLLAPRD